MSKYNARSIIVKPNELKQKADKLMFGSFVYHNPEEDNPTVLKVPVELYNYLLGMGHNTWFAVEAIHSIQRFKHNLAEYLDWDVCEVDFAIESLCSYLGRFSDIVDIL